MFLIRVLAKPNTGIAYAYNHISELDGLPVPERVKTETRQMIISSF